MGSLVEILPALLVAIIVFLLGNTTSKVASRSWLEKSTIGKRISTLFSLRQTSTENLRGTAKSSINYKRASSQSNGDLALYKEYYHKIQNLEKYPEILAPARDLLISFFAETIEKACSSKDQGILSIQDYSSEKLGAFIQAELDIIGDEWEEYVSRRRAGGSMEMFKDKDECFWWLKQVAPVKYVDGAWLGHINKVSTPFSLRKATKDAWQIMSEELGDGLPVMNHVFVYRKLMQDICPGFPEADSIDFIHPRHELNEETPWKAAVAQLLISLFPHEFLPEILGFNMHFEALTIETMKASKEVEEMGFDAYYFFLHISIDNADSGHTAIAMQAVIKYLELIRQTEGDASVQHMWKRVQAGYILSKHLAISPEPSSSQPFPRNEREKEVIDIFRAKAPVAQKVHCTTRMKIAGRSIVDWLEPQALESKDWQMEFLDSLSNFRPWVRKADSEGSKLMQELSWGGKMFGSFTKSEVEAVRKWIDGLGRTDPHMYWSFVKRPETKSDLLLKDRDIRCDYPVFSGNVKTFLPGSMQPRSASPLPPPVFYSSETTDNTSSNLSITSISKLIPLWFTHQCLLEPFVNVPAKTTTNMASTIVRILRAQYGFDVEGFSVAGMDEARREDSAGIVEIGLEILQKLGFGQANSLKDVLDKYPSEFAQQMLHLSMRPMECSSLLLGLSWAFVGLHDLMSRSTLLSADRRAILTDMVRREHQLFETCFRELEDDEDQRSEFLTAYTWGRKEINDCLDGLICEPTFRAQSVSGLGYQVAVSA